MSSVLSTRDLRVTFPTPAGRVLAVRGVNLDVARGEVVGIVGESGSGKSVSFLSILGLLPPSAIISGSATLDGTELIGADMKTIRSVRGKRMSMIFQDPLSALNPVHRIGDQIVEMILAHQSLTKQQAHDRAVELLDLVGLPQPAVRAKQYPHEFSGGMRQRVMIAMAIANEPDVLIADEPTTALDVTVQAQILDVLMEVKSRLNTAVVFITHDLGVIARIADRVEVMYAGMTVERAEVNDMFATPGHPYTRGLMASLPQVGRQRLQPIVGSPPNMIAPPSGCAFRPRCAEASDECASAPMTLVRVGKTETACVRAQSAGVSA
jgi:peptide/nickel transport system ATP-binding protein